MEEKSATYGEKPPSSKLTLDVVASPESSPLDPIAIGQRIKAARTHFSLTQEALAKLVGGSKPGIQDNEAGKNIPGGKVIGGLIRLGINANWLLTGEGPMMLAGTGSDGSPIDLRRLGTAIRELEAALERSRRTLDPELKARAVGVLYEFQGQGSTKPMAVDRLLDLVT